MKRTCKAAVLMLPFMMTTGALIAAPGTIDLHLLQTIADAEGDARLDYAAVDSATHRLYVARGDGVMSLDLDSNKVTHQLVAGKHVHAVVPLAGNRVLSTNGDSHSVMLFDGTSGRVIAETPAGDKPDGALFETTSGLVFVMDAKNGGITLIDPADGSVKGKIQVGGKLESAAADGKGRVFVNVEERGEVAVIDVAARKVITRYSLPGCDGPTGLALDPQLGLLVASCDNRIAVAIHSADGTAVDVKLPIDRSPDAVIFDPKRKEFFIPCGRDGTLVVIGETATGTLSVIGTVPTAVGAHTGALDPKTGRIYLPTANYHLSLSGIEPAPGSFRVLVLGSQE